MSIDAQIYNNLKTNSAKLRWLGLMRKKNSLNQPVLLWIKNEEKKLKGV